MNLDGIKNKVKQAADKVMNDEAKSDAALDKAAEAASKVTGGKYDDKIKSVRDEADKRIGDEGAADKPAEPKAEKPTETPETPKQ